MFFSNSETQAKERPHLNSLRSADCLTGKAISERRETKVTAQRRRFVCGPEQTSSLEFGHDFIHEVAEGRRRLIRDHVEAIGRSGREPLLHMIRDLLGCANDDAVSISDRDRLIELSKRPVVAV